MYVFDWILYDLLVCLFVLGCFVSVTVFGFDWYCFDSVFGCCFYVDLTVCD